MEVLGLPPSSVMRKIRRPHLFFTDEGEPRYLVERREKMENRVFLSLLCVRLPELRLNELFFKITLNSLEPNSFTSFYHGIVLDKNE